MKKFKAVLIISAACLLSAGSLGCGSSNAPMVAPITGVPAAAYVPYGTTSCPAGVIAINGACTNYTDMTSACASRSGQLVTNPANGSQGCKISNGSVQVSMACSTGSILGIPDVHCSMNGSGSEIISSPIQNISIGSVVNGDTLSVTASSPSMSSLTIVLNGQPLIATGLTSGVAIAPSSGTLSVAWTGSTASGENFSVNVTDTHCSDATNTSFQCQ